MIRLFKHYVPTPLLLLGLIDFLVLLGAAELAWQIRRVQISMASFPVSHRITELLTFAVITSLTMLAVGLYQAAGFRAWRMTATRLSTALMFAFAALSMIYFLVPDVALWRSIAVYAVLISLIGLVAVRTLFARLVVWDGMRRRVLVLGAGVRAQRLRVIADARDANFRVVRFVRMTEAEPAVPGALAWSAIPSLPALVEREGVEEIVLAIEERRGALPVDQLVGVKLSGVRVSEMSTFLERETGRVDLSSISPSWLIFSDGFLGANLLGLLIKRLIDVVASLLLLAATAPVLVITAILVKATSRGPVFYLQERVGQFGRRFNVIKFRSMRTDAEIDGKPRWAAERDPRVTAVGRIIRATRIDEVPQIINVLRGDMSFVGPRPERPYFVDELAAKIPYFNERHIVKPGITGWAQLNYPYGASVDDARCKLEYDLYYVKNYSSFLDLLILVQTLRVILWREGVR